MQDIKNGQTGIKNGQTNAFSITEPRIVTLSGENVLPPSESPQVFFKESIAQKVDEEGRQNQYILVLDDILPSFIKLTLKKCTLDAHECLNGNSKVVFKVDHLDESRIIVFSAATLKDTQIEYATAVKDDCDENNLKNASSKSPATSNDIQTISGEISKLSFQCLNYDDGVMTKSKDTCPTYPLDVHRFKIEHEGVIKIVTVYNSTFKTSVCYKINSGNFLSVIKLLFKFL